MAGAKGVAIGKACERRGQPCVRVDASEFAVFDERGDDDPVVAALVGASKQCVLAVQSKRADGALDDVVIEVDADIFEEADGAVPGGRL